MAGTLTISTLSDGTNSTSTTNCIQGSAKAWVNFNGTGSVSTNQTIRASYNVSSVFKNGTGDYTVNFTNAISDANYSVSGVASDNNTVYSGAAQSSTTLSTRSFSTTSVRVLSVYAYTPAARDADVVCVAIHR